MSLDGFIAGEHDDLGFLSLVEQEGEDYGYAEFYKTIDTVIMGRKTYEKVLSFGIPYPHRDIRSYIITRTGRESEENIVFYDGGMADLVHRLQGEAGGHIFIDGGAEVVNLFIKEALIDEFVISVIPVLLGGGVRLFAEDNPFQRLALAGTRSFEKGLVQLHYSRAVQTQE